MVVQKKKKKKKRRGRRGLRKKKKKANACYILAPAVKFSILGHDFSQIGDGKFSAAILSLKDRVVKILPKKKKKRGETGEIIGYCPKRLA